MKRWLPPLSTSILRRNSVPSSNVSSFLVLSSSHDLISPTTTGFKVLSEAERTAALYSLLQHSTQVQIRPRPVLSIPAPRTVNHQPSTRPPPSYLPIPPITSATQAMPRLHSLNSVPNSKQPATPPIEYQLRLPPRVQESVVHGVSSLGQVAEHDNSPTLNMTIETRSSRSQSTDFSALSGSPAFCSPRPGGGVASLDGLSPLWATAGRA